MLNTILSLPRSIKRVISIIIDILFIVGSYFLALGIRLNFHEEVIKTDNWYIVLCVSVISILAFIRLGLYRAVLRFITIKFTQVAIVGTALSTAALLLVTFALQFSLPRTVLFLYFVFLSIFVICTRFLWRAMLSYDRHDKTRVIIYGAGSSGRQLLTALNQASNYLVVGFVDDNKNLHRTVMHGITVYNPKSLDKLIESRNVKKILLAMPSASQTQRKKIINRISKYKCEILTVPGMEDIVSGKAHLTSLNQISISDLLGRDIVKPIDTLLNQDIKNKVVMVTGAGGSIGSELCRQIVKQQPKKLVLFELSEFSLYQIHQELLQNENVRTDKIELVPLLGSVQRKHRLDIIMRSFQVETVYHAAAYKHVPLVEYNVVEGIRNNIFGTLSCAQAAIEAKVSTFVLISTDKAVRPTNIMGTTKRMAELVLQALASKQNTTRFCMVRFGNVLGSSGSVVPLFNKQIREGGPITLTHRKITRFFMTIPEAASLVIQAGAMGKGGDVFVLDMGEPVKIYDLAVKMVNLSGLTVRNEKNPDGDIEIKVTGLRPGEKLYEELLIGENVHGTTHPRIMTATEIMIEWDKLSVILEQLDKLCAEYKIDEIRELLMRSSTGFNPTTEICDLVYRNNKYNLKDKIL
ncbi:polysaccharide biosynthesis protein [Gallibacterium anatis]|uniref:Nucleoside-diphosphate sugar epimerase n=1 Tax=Gallibacterium anatis TaxID=750 RepID=A0A1A7NR83_9PAST|nr:nucleoside-diphosphate sugar epimerase/dehydratase [Gallibacterium anatis]OBW92120.1 nucleoside-diphosphate sugar epimerase [Gallibacterium anatis]OBW99777.1 nucleoside-diphosphate sugar epimerase [Gallibacterium anatis]